MAKRVQRRVKKRPKPASHTNLLLIERVLKLLISVVVLLLIAMSSYFYGYQTGREEVNSTLLEEKQVRQKLERTVKRFENQTAAHEYDVAPPKEEVPVIKRQKVTPSPVHKPLMAIIIDDVSFSHDVKNIEAMGLTVTMSFLPPSDRHPSSAALAQDVAGYMVHLPMQAQRFNHEEPFTLHVGDSAATIEERVREITRLYPRVRYVNNHTGSLFTEDMDSMRKLVAALDRHDITFIDSRTTAKTAVPKLMASLHRPYISRDVFLDHSPEIAEIKKQIRRAVKIAKKYGYVIAIGHPHKKTLQALKESEGVLRGVDLVPIDTLVRHLKR